MKKNLGQKLALRKGRKTEKGAIELDQRQGGSTCKQMSRWKKERSSPGRIVREWEEKGTKKRKTTRH